MEAKGGSVIGHMNNPELAKLPVKEHDLTQILVNYNHIFKKALEQQATSKMALIISKRRIDGIVLPLVNGDLEAICKSVDGNTTCKEREIIESSQAENLSKHVQFCKELLTKISHNIGICLVSLENKILKKNHFTPHSKKLYDVLINMFEACKRTTAKPLNSFLEAYEAGINDKDFGKKIHKDLSPIFDRYHPKNTDEAIDRLKYWNTHDYKSDIHIRDEEALVWLGVNSQEYFKEYKLNRFLKVLDITRSYIKEGGSLFTDIAIGTALMGEFPNNKEEFFTSLFTKIYCKAHGIDSVDKSIIDSEVQKFVKSENCFCRNLLVFGTIDTILLVLKFFDKQCGFNNYFTRGTNTNTTRLSIPYIEFIDDKLHFNLSLKRAFEIKEGHAVVGKIDYEFNFSTEQPNNKGYKADENGKRSDKIYCTIHPSITPKKNVSEETLKKLKICLKPREKD